MACKALLTNGTFTTGTWRGVEAYNVGWVWSSSTANYDDTYTERTINVTFANNGNQLGIVLPLYNTGGTARTVTIKLYEGASLRTTDTFTFNDTLIQGKDIIRYFALTSYPVTTAASTWSYKISCSGPGRVYWYRSTTAGDWGYLCVLDAVTTAPSSGDSLVITNGCTFTIDQSITTNVLASNRAAFLCDQAALVWVNPPPASYTWTLNGVIATSSWASNFTIGTDASPIPVANRAIINFSAAVTGSYLIDMASYALNHQQSSFYRSWVGAESSLIRTETAQAALASQADIVTVDDCSTAWSIGDRLTIVGKDKASSDAVSYTISNIVGTTITLNTDLDAAVLAGAAVVNASEGDNLGIKLIGNASVANLGCYSSQFILYDKVVGVFMQYMGHGSATASVYSTIGVLNSSSVCTYRSILVEVGGTGNTGLTLVASLETYRNFLGGHTITNCHYYNPFNINTGNILRMGANSGWTLSNITIKSATATTIISLGTTKGMVGSDIILFGSSYSGGMWISGGGANTFTDLLLVYAGGIRVGCSTTTFTRYKSYRTPCPIFFDTGSDDTFRDCTFANDTTVVSGINNPFVRCLVDNTTFASTTNFNITANTPTSYVKYNTFNGTANDHRMYTPYGNTQSTGDGLTDTTVHTSGSGKFAIRFEPTSSTNNLEWEFTIPTGNIQNKTMTISVWCKMNSATYYSGTHQLPRLTIDYDNGTPAHHQAGETTDWQLLFVTFTPTTTYGQITVTLSGRTDATTTNAYIYFDDFTVAYPPSVALDLGGMDNWANALPVTPPIALPISAGTVAQNVWQQLTATSWGTGSMGEQLKIVDDKADIADAVWDEQTSDHTVAGSTGKAVTTGSKKIVVIDGGEVPIYES